MGIPAPSTRVSLIGHLGANEIFDTSFWLNAAPSTPTEANAQALAIAGAATAGLDDWIGFTLAPTDGIDEVRTYCYPDGGPAATVIGSAPLSLDGNVNRNCLYQQCIVTTMLTGYAGRSYRGRMYWPNAHATVADGTIGPTGFDAALTALGAFFDEVMNVTDGVVGVVSQTQTQFHQVIGLRADNKPDIQRRRANSQSATAIYSVALNPL